MYKLYKPMFPSPSRGSYFSMQQVWMDSWNMSSFRPLPGDLISQLDENVSLYTVNIAFPSPSRGSYFSIMILIPDSGKPQRFRPLPGDLISQSYRCRRTAWSYFVSVPFTGILFLNNKHYIATWNNRKSFRPLPGDLISQLRSRQ